MEPLAIINSAKGIINIKCEISTESDWQKSFIGQKYGKTKIIQKLHPTKLKQLLKDTMKERNIMILTIVKLLKE